MNRILRVLLLVAVLTLPALATEASADNGPTPMPCELAVEKRASELIFDLRLVLGQSNALSNDEFSQIRGVLDALDKNATSALALQCFRQYPVQEQRYQRWLRRQASEIRSTAIGRLETTCTRRTHLFINSQRLRIDWAMQHKKLAQAARRAEEMRKALQEDPMMAPCSGTADQVAQLQNDFIPSIVNQAALPRVQEKMAMAYNTVKQAIDAADQAMRSPAEKLTPAPEVLSSPSGFQELREELARCNDYAQALKELGAPPTLELRSSDGAAAPLLVASAYCQEQNEGLDDMLGAIVAHQQRYDEHMLMRWRRVSIKGWGMEVAFDKKGRPQSESILAGGTILWNYRSDTVCSQMRFSPRGKLVSDTETQCPELPSATQGAPDPEPRS